jgi:cold shock CspA family protein
MNHGTVKLWKQMDGWGFIEGDDGEDYFFNISSIRKGQRVRENLKVKFDTEETQKGTQAVNVSLS